MTPFSLNFEQAALDDLQQRLARVRWPDEPPGPAWQTGTSLAWLQSLVAHWRSGFDWRAQEAALNRFHQFKTRVDGVPLHFIHEPGRGPAPMPLLLLHGWPGSVFEFTELIPRLTDPAAFGGDERDAFTVVAPSLPGYTLSFEPGQPRLGPPAMAAVLHRLMTGTLGLTRYAAQGGDWGSFIATCLGRSEPGSLIGLHLNMLPLRLDEKARREPDEDERRYALEARRWVRDEAGYQAIQGSKPQTLAYALNDSPVGLAAWIAEKFHGWSDNDGNPESAIPRDAMLADITLYWLTGSIGASFGPYHALRRDGWPFAEGQAVTVSTGYAQFPREMLRPPRALAERSFSDLRRWTVMPRGGHFAAWEQPDLLATELREFFRPLRGS